MMAQVLVDQPLHPPRRDDGHRPHRTDLLADLLERLQQPGIARALEHDAVELLAERKHVGGGGLGAAPLISRKRASKPCQFPALEARRGEARRERLEGLADLVELAHVVVARWTRRSPSSAPRSAADGLGLARASRTGVELRASPRQLLLGERLRGHELALEDVRRNAS